MLHGKVKRSIKDVWCLLQHYKIPLLILHPEIVYSLLNELQKKKKNKDCNGYSVASLICNGFSFEFATDLPLQ